MDINFKTSIAGKVSYPDETQNAPAKAADAPVVTEEEVENSILNVISGGGEYAEEGVPNPFSMQIGKTADPGYVVDPITGKKVKDASANPYYVPTLETVELEMKARELPLSLKMIEKIKENYTSAKTYAQDALKNLEKQKNIYASDPSKVEYLDKLIALAREAKQTAVDALEKLPIWKKELEACYKQEYADFQSIGKNCYEKFNKGDAAKKRSIVINEFKKADLNNDGWIGEPDKGLKIDEVNGVLYDSETSDYIRNISPNGTPVTSKWFDPSATWNVAGEGLSLATEKVGKEDLTLKVDESSKTEKNNTFNAKMDISIPEYVVVKTDSEGFPKERSDSDGNYRYTPVAFTVENGAIKQNVPDKLEGYAQVFISSVEIVSDEENMDKKGYDQIVRFLDKNGTIAAEIRLTCRGGQRSASDYGLAVNGNCRTKPVSINASEMKTTGRHQISKDCKDDLMKEYGISFDNKKLQNAGKAKSNFEKNIKLWTGGSETGLDPMTSEVNTGLMSYGLSGYIQGAKNANNFVCFKAPDGQSAEPREGKDEDDNPLYKNVFVGGNQYNAVLSSGKGDLYASGVTLGWRDAKDSKATSSFSINNKIIGKDDKKKNVDVLAVMLGSGDKLIDNESDASVSEKGEVSFENGDDYFDTEREGNYAIAKETDDGGIGDPDADTLESDKGAIDKIMIEEIGMTIEDALNDIDIDEEDPMDELTKGELGGDVYSSISSGQDTFFSDITAWFGFTNEGMESWLEEDSEDPLTVDEDL